MLKTSRSVAAAPVANDWGSRRHGHALVLIAATAGGILLCCLMIAPFVNVLTWALALAIVLAPLQRRIERKVKSRGLAAAITVSLLVLVIAAIVTFIGVPLVGEATKGVNLLTEKIQSGEWQRIFAAHPRLMPLAQRALEEGDLPKLAGSAAGWITGAVGMFVRGSLVQIVSFVLIGYLLFFLLRDRRAALGLLSSLSPLTPKEMDRLEQGVDDTVHATLFGTITVAAVQGTLGGLMFWILGLPTPMLWGVMMMVMALIPVLGTFVIWAPAAAVLALQGEWGRALILTGWGAIAVGGIDNVLYPILVGRKLNMHTLFTFFSLVGGLFIFGGAGLVLGPVTLTITKVLLEVWRTRNERTLDDSAESTPA